MPDNNMAEMMKALIEQNKVIMEMIHLIIYFISLRAWFFLTMLGIYIYFYI